MGFYSRFNGFGRLPSEGIVPTVTAIPRGMPGGQVVVRSSDIVRKTPSAIPTVLDESYADGLYGTPSFLSTPVVGPVVVWHLLAAAGLAGAGYVAYRKFRK